MGGYSMDADGWLVLHFTARSMYEPRPWMLSFGPQAEALALEELRAEVSGAAADVAARYGATI
jgi:hypothetical protein